MKNNYSSLFPSNDIQTPIGWRHGQLITRGLLNAEINAWKEKFHILSTTKIAIYIEDTLTFIPAFIAALLENKTIYLVQNILPKTLDSLSKQVSEFVGNFPSQYHPINLEPNLKLNEIELDIKIDPSIEIFIYTSGSTGTPQSFSRSIEQYLIESQSIELLFGSICKQSRIVSTVSHNHSYGLTCKVFWPLLTQRSIESESINYPESLAQAIKKGPLVFISSPAHLKRFSKSDVFQDSSQSIQAIFSAGGILDRDTALSIHALFGTTPIDIYGCSEVGIVAWKQFTNVSNENWTPFPKITWKINSEGLLEIKTPHITSSDWYCLSDKAEAKHNNQFILKGRKDRIVKIEEKRVSLSSIEKALLASGYVDECRAIVVENESLQRIASIIVLNEKGKAFLENESKLKLNQVLKSYLKDSFELVTLPKIWRYVDSLPINSLGKVTQNDLLALLK